MKCSDEELHAAAVIVCESLQDYSALDASTILTLALSVVLSSGEVTAGIEKTCDLFRAALRDQLIRIAGRDARGETPPS